jgi:predicted DCC family thiol-disulfide oxidoreductase YuxK
LSFGFDLHTISIKPGGWDAIMPDSKPDRPLLIYDGECSFCRIWIDYWQRLTADRVLYAPFQEAAENFPQVPLQNFERAVQLILPDGSIRSAARAVFTSLTYAPGLAWLLWLYEHLPGFAPISEWAYRLVAARRDFFYKVTVFLWGRQLEPARHRVLSELFFKALAIIYFIAFASLGVQLLGLIGSDGILPANGFLQFIHANFGANSYSLIPTVFWLNSSDTILQIACLAGAVLSLALLLGRARRVILILLFILYLSFVSVGQDFLSFQWDALLLETGFLAIFLDSSTAISIWLFRWLLFRLMFSSGAVKLLSGDPAWHNLTALDYHFETQPLPTIFGWLMAQLPEWFHQLSAVITFFIELIVPFLIFAPRHLRFFAAASIVFLQVLIFLTGNYTFFNLLTIALCLFLLDDAALRRLVPRRWADRFTRPDRPRSPIGRRVLIGLAVILIVLSGFRFWGGLTGQLAEPVDAVLHALAPYRIFNSYGLFAVMTTSRLEISVEGSNDDQTWLPYEFNYKPGDLRRPPLWVQPHQPRLDWQLWFAALGNYQQNPWFVNFMVRLLQGSPPVLSLLGHNPFPDAPPKYVRAMLYAYHFTDWATLQVTGQWWRRDLIGVYLPPISLQAVQ